MTKPIVILILGCLPLAVLTVASFAGIGDLGLGTSLDPTSGIWSLPGASAPVPSVARSGRRQDPLCCRCGTGVSGGRASARTRRWKPIRSIWLRLAGNWQHWSDATSLVRDVLAMEQSLIGAGLPQLESALDRIGDDPGRVPEEGSRGSRPPDRRSGTTQGRELQAEIALRKNREKVARLREMPSRRCGNKDYDKAIKICDQMLDEYGGGELPDRLGPATQGDVLARMVEVAPRISRHGGAGETAGRARRTSWTRTGICRARWSRNESLRVTPSGSSLVEAELRRIEMNEAARVPIAVLARYDGQAFAEGLAEAAEVAETYPTDSVRGQLQERVVSGWRQSLPQKQLDEPDGI